MGRICRLLLLMALALAGSGRSWAADPLTADERAWLTAHDGTIRLAPVPGYPPVDFLDDQGVPVGLSQDYVRLLEERLGCRFQLVILPDFPTVIAQLRSREVDLTTSVSLMQERLSFLDFQAPHFRAEKVIIVREGTPGVTGLVDLAGKTVALVEGYEYTKRIREDHPGIRILSAKDEPSGIKDLALGRADAFIGDLASATFNIKALGLSNLRVAGPTGLGFDLRMASRNDWPMLTRILAKGLALITPGERQAIYEKWVHLHAPPFYATRGFWYLLGGCALAGGSVAGFLLLWRGTLRRQVRIRTLRLDQALARSVRSERDARRSEERLQTLVHTAMDGFCLVDLQGRILQVNSTYCRMVGYSEDELLTLSISDVEVEESVASTSARIRRIVEQGQERFATRHRRKDGVVIDVEVSTQYQPWDGGQVVVFIRDITGVVNADAARRAHERELLERNQFIETILDNLPIGLAVNHIHGGRAVYMNRKFEEIYGWPRRELEDIEGFFERVYPDPEYRQEIKDRVIADIQSNDPERMAWDGVRVTGKDGSHRIVYAKNIPIHDQGLMVSTVQDITKRVELQEQLQQSQKMDAVGRLAGGVAHDFNNKLGVILGHVEFALQRIGASGPLADDLAAVQHAAERSADLTRQLLAFARKQTVAPQVLDLNEAVEGLCKMLRRVIGEDVELAWSPGETPLPVRMDPSQLDQVLVNLCVNARDAIGGVGRIQIEADSLGEAEIAATHGQKVPAGDYVRLVVRDDGCGMDAETLARVFEPFFTTKTVGQGTGLGLATVYGIVKQNNGFIFVQSEPGRGAAFAICLPRHVFPASEEPRAAADDSRVGGDETILLVEDDAAILKVTQAMLTALGYEVLAANSPAAAIRVARERAGSIQLLVTDVIMPEMNGRDLARTLGDLQPGLKCLFMSGYTDEVIAHRGILEPGTHFISKPFSSKELAAKVREVLAGA